MSAATALQFDADKRSSLLAWAGWQLKMPSDWRPLKLMGTPAKGWMIVGDAMCAFFSIHWERAQEKLVSDGEAWVQQRLHKQGLSPDPSPPTFEGFSACSWAHKVQTEEGKQTTFWYGYADSADLLVGVKVNGILDEQLRDRVTEDVLPTLQALPADRGSTWAMHDLSFQAPSGFEQVQRHLFAGDVALQFQREPGEFLMLRQVYPGGLALERRAHRRWLEKTPFKDVRNLRKKSSTFEDWQVGDGSRYVGKYQLGRKMVAPPLGFIAPRWTNALSVHDLELNRLLIAEHITPRQSDRSVCESAILAMNRSALGGPVR